MGGRERKREARLLPSKNLNVTLYMEKRVQVGSEVGKEAKGSIIWVRKLFYTFRFKEKPSPCVSQSVQKVRREKNKKEM